MREWGNERGRKKEGERDRGRRGSDIWIVREIKGQGRRMRKGDRRGKGGRERRVSM